jgi:rubrerythrin
MTEDQSKAAEALKQAMNLEREGRQFYLKAAETAADEKAKEMFRSLAEDEEIHLTQLGRQLDSLESSGQWIEMPEARGAKISPELSVFPENPESALKTSGRPADLEALIFGMEAEMKSFALYAQQASEVADPAAKDMYRFIASQEQAHFNTLMMRYQSFSITPDW